MSYTIDVFRRRIAPEPSLLRFAVFVTFFPHLVAGPIVRACDFLPQLKLDRRFHWERLVDGMLLTLWGLFLKCVVADSLAIVVDSRFLAPISFSGLSLMIAVFFYAFQIYCDFHGYSSIAIGLAKVYGFDLNQNFDRPYFATSFTDFWQRWHISLSQWLRDYLYIPLGGSRVGRYATMRNLMITMILGGLWHGADWKFVIWGALHGLYLCCQRVIVRVAANYFPKSIREHRATRVLATLCVFALISVAWVFFRANSLEDAMLVLKKIFRSDEYDFASITQKYHIAKGIGLISFLLLSEWSSFYFEPRLVLKRIPWIVPLIIAMLYWTLALLGTYDGNAFIYFRF